MPIQRVNTLKRPSTDIAWFTLRDNYKSTRQQLIDEGKLTSQDRKSTRLNSSHSQQSRMPSSA